MARDSRTGFRRERGQAKSRKEEYKERYEASKLGGETFYPFTLFKDGIVMLVIFLVVVGLALSLGAELESIADPTDNTYNPRPEWYFLFVFQLLKYFPGSLEPVAAVLLPGVGVLLLLLLPFLDRNPQRHPQRRVVASSLGVLALAGIIVLTYFGATSALVNPPTREAPMLVEGKKLYRELNCAYCHSIDGSGGVIGPDLTNVGARRTDRQWVAAHFKDPQAVSPGSIMPKLQLLDEEVEALTAYMLSLGAVPTYTAGAPGLFQQNCAACHTTDGKGGTMGPDLSLVGKNRTLPFIHQYIENPKALSPGALMPGFSDKLSHEQVEDIARYLVSLKARSAQ